MTTEHQRDTLATCLTQVFGGAGEAIVDELLPLLTWVELTGGRTLMREGDPADGVYFVISGRLRAHVQRDGEMVPVGEIARGETVGEMGVLTGEARSATVIAVRDTVLAHASAEVFDQLLLRHPDLSIQLARIVVGRLRRTTARPRVKRPAVVCLLGVTEGVDLPRFADALLRHLAPRGAAALETSASIDLALGEGSAQATRNDPAAYHSVTARLDDLEFSNETVLLVADPGDTAWTRRCLRHADEVLLLANADQTPALHPLERNLCAGEGKITGGRQTLLLLHDPQRNHPTSTPDWLDRRPVDAHLHLRKGVERDLARLARVVSGNAIGLVFAGGGARGFAHLGVYKALSEAGVEIDFVGGTSIGAAMAAYVSFDLPPETVIALARRAFASNPTGDVNVLPLVSLIGGRRLRSTVNRAIVDAIGHAADMTDSWRTMYCVATSYSGAREVVIHRGNLARAIRASAAIPVALPPVTWQGELLIDGGVFNNFPTNVMAKIGARRIIGVDLARRSDRRYEFEEVPGTLRLLWDRLRGRKRRRFRLPGLGGFLMGTTILYSESRRESAKEGVDVYLNPDLARVPLLDWKSFDRIVDLGYRHTRDVLAAMPPEELALYGDETRSAQPIP